MFGLHAQTVDFANSSTTLIRTNQPGGASGGIAGAQQYRIGLYVGTVGSPASSLTLVGLGTNAPLAGRFNANPSGGFFTLPSPYASGNQLAFQVRAWSLASGTSYEAALASGAGWLGTSTLGVTTLGGGTVLPGSLFSATPVVDANGNLPVTGFDLQPVPEPSSIALGLLGLGAIALFRRRK